jgi:alkylation response protein AidB-like acyl-CoA dehydrogenase
MYFALDPDQLSLQESVRTWAGTYATEAAVRETMATADGFDEAAWDELSDKIGAVPPGDADRPLTLTDSVAVLEVLAGALYPGPYLGAVVAAAVRAQLDGGGDEGAEPGPGRVIAAWPRERTDHLEVSGSERAPKISGVLYPVVDAVTAERLVLCAGDSWYAVPVGAAVHVEPVPGFDQTRRLGRVRLAEAPAQRLAARRPAGEILAAAQLAEQVAVAAENTGVARHCLDAGVEYARNRRQFGRPIGAFQALQHWFADVALAVECAWGATYQAAEDVTSRREEAARSALLAAAASGEAALAAAEQYVQVLGGNGFTWDYPAHLYLKRAKGNRMLFGHPDSHRARLGELLGL